MIRTIFIGVALLMAAGLGAGQVQAGQDVPPPRAIRPVQPSLSSTGFAASPAALWRDTPPVLQGWSPDRRIPVVGFDRFSPCAGRSLAGMASADDGWFEDEGDFAEAGFDDGEFASWEDM